MKQELWKINQMIRDGTRLRTDNVVVNTWPSVYFGELVPQERTKNHQKKRRDRTKITTGRKLHSIIIIFTPWFGQKITFVSKFYTESGAFKKVIMYRKHNYDYRDHCDNTAFPHTCGLSTTDAAWWHFLVLFHTLIWPQLCHQLL